MNEISSSALIDVQMTLLCIGGVDPKIDPATGVTSTFKIATRHKVARGGRNIFCRH